MFLERHGGFQITGPSSAAPDGSLQKSGGCLQFEQLQQSIPMFRGLVGLVVLRHGEQTLVPLRKNRKWPTRASRTRKGRAYFLSSKSRRKMIHCTQSLPV